MSRILLYYPTIDIPKKEWLNSALLYTDKVSSILPNSDEAYLTDTLKYLMWKEEYSPIYINDLLKNYSQQFEKFEQHFITAINDMRFLYLGSATPRDKKFQSIYYDKMTRNILQELDKRNLIEKNEEQLIMPENAAIYYMSILAQFVAEVDKSKNIIIPSTDYKRFSDVSFSNLNYNNKAINLILSNCLPVPDINTPLSDIVDFKKKHRDELLRFRLYLGGVINEINTARDDMDVKEILVSIEEKIELELNSLSEIYKRNKIKTVATTLDSLLSFENPKLFSTLLAAGILSSTIKPIVGLGFAGLSIGAKWISSYYENNTHLKSNELNYLFEAKKQGIIKSSG